VNFVVVDLDQKIPDAQKALVQKYYRGYIPHVAIVDRFGHTLYSDAGEVDEAVVGKFLEKALSK
jgi:hypothetical protein